MIGLEPTTFAVTGRRSNQLSHWAIPENTLFVPSKPNTETSISYTLTYILFLSKTFGQALDRLVNVS